MQKAQVQPAPGLMSALTERSFTSPTPRTYAIRALDLKASMESRRSQARSGRRLPGCRRFPSAVRPAKGNGSEPSTGTSSGSRTRRPSLYRHGRATPDLEAQPRNEHHRRVRRSQDTRTLRTTPRFRQVRPAGSGLATGGKNLFVADSEVSGIRASAGIAAKEPFVRTIVRTGLFNFGDRDGQRGSRSCFNTALGRSIRRQPPALCRGYVQQSRQGLQSPRTQEVKSLVPDRISPAKAMIPVVVLSAGRAECRPGSSLYVADTNNHKVRVVDHKNQLGQDTGPGRISTFASPGASCPELFARAKVDVRCRRSRCRRETRSSSRSRSHCRRAAEAQCGGTATSYLVETPGKTGILAPQVSPEGGVDQAADDPVTSRSKCHSPRPLPPE